MTESPTVNIIKDKPVSSAPEKGTGEKVYFNVTRSEWLWDTVFLLSLSLIGLEMPLGYLLVVILLLKSWNTDREGFIIKLTLVLGGYALTRANIQWGINPLFFVTTLSLFGMCVFKKTRQLKMILLLYFAYAALTWLEAFISDETIGNQFRTILEYLAFCFFIIPMMAFSGKPFDMHRFWTRLFTIQLIICVFYILDAYVFRGWVLIPQSWIDFKGTKSTWMHLLMRGPMGLIPRKYPPGLYPMALLIYPIARYYKMKWWQWVIVIVAIMSTKTFTFYTAILVGYFFSIGKVKTLIIYGTLGLAALVGLYFIDDSMGYTGEDESYMQSKLRIASSINQLVAVGDAEDDEDVSSAGSGRAAQAISKFENIFEQEKTFFGFGFIPPDTKNPKFLVYNEYIPDPTMRYTNCIEVEIAPIQLFLKLGFFGLVVHVLFLFGLCWLLREDRYRGYFYNVMLVIVWYGLGGFSGWLFKEGIYLGSLAFATVLLANKPISKEEYPHEDVPLLT